MNSYATVYSFGGDGAAGGSFSRGMTMVTPRFLPAFFTRVFYPRFLPD
jgi:hypothetical protein